METRIPITIGAASTSTPGPGGWAAVVQIPKHGLIRVSGSDPEARTGQMELTAMVRGLAAVHELVDVSGTTMQVVTDSELLIANFSWWLRTGESGCDQELWEQIGEMNQKAGISLTPADLGDPAMLECSVTSSKEAMAAAQNRGLGPQSHTGNWAGTNPEPWEQIGEMNQKLADDSFLKGYLAGYEAARTDMANQLNRIRPVSPLTAEEPEELPF